MRSDRQLGILAVLVAMCGSCGVVAQELICPTVSSGGSNSLDASIHVVGQFAAGLITNDPDELDQGAVPCWVGNCVGDLDEDGQIDLADLAILLANFATPADANPEDGDLDLDGDIDLTDLALLLSVFATFCP